MERTYEICEECGAVSHGNIFCNTCRTEMNKTLKTKLPPWNHPAEKPCGPEDIQAFIEQLNQMNLREGEIIVHVQ